MKKYVRTISFLILCLTSCSSVAIKETAISAEENDWTQGLVCEFPCWQNTTPQETPFSVVAPYLTDGDVQIIFESEREIEFQLQDNVAGVIRKASGDEVDMIALSLHARKTTFDEVVRIIGNPGFLNVGESFGDVNDCSLIVVFPDKGVILELFAVKDDFSEKTDCHVNIGKDSQIYRIILVGNVNSSEFWKNISYSNLDYVEWRGYGIYP